MIEAAITVKNYRCFEDSKPATFRIGPGFTSFVGPNNSGKSSALRMFYEIRNIFDQNEALQDLLQSPRDISFGAQGVSDDLEIFCKSNPRDIHIDISMPADADENGTPALDQAQIVIKRDGEHVFWKLENSWAREKGEGFGIVDQAFIDPSGRPLVKFAGFLDLFRCLKGALYVGPFRNATTEASGDYYDISIGTDFVNTWDAWKNGGQLDRSERMQKVSSDIERIFGLKRLEINTSNPLKTLLLVVDGASYKLKELGAGMAQFIVVLANAAIKQPSMILIDEPELNLHPSLQLDFLTTLASYTTEGIVVFATHSIGLARAASERIHSLKRENGHVVVTPFEQTPNYAEFAGEMGYSGFKEIGCEQILLVEGPTDIKTVQQFLRKYGLDHKIVLIQLGGRSMINGEVQHELAELKRITDQVAVLIDSERVKDGGPVSAERKAFVALCKKLGFKVCVVRRQNNSDKKTI